MTIFHYFNFEPSLIDDGWDITEVGDGIADRAAAAGYPDGVGFGLRAVAGSILANVAFGKRDSLSISVPADTSVYIGHRVKFNAGPTNTTFLLSYNRDGLLTGIDSIGSLRLRSTGQLIIGFHNDEGAPSGSGFSVGSLTAETWYWVVTEIHRASSAVADDGYIKTFVNGIEWLDTGAYDNYDRVETLEFFQIGIVQDAWDGFIVDFDEIKIADVLPEETGGFYTIYNRLSPTLDWSFLKNVPAGTHLLDTPQADDTILYYGISATSLLGVESVVGKIRVERAGGLLLSARPNRIFDASAAATAAGKIEVTFTYSHQGSSVVATTIEIGQVIAGVADFSSPLATISIPAAGIVQRTSEITGTFYTGETLELVARALTAESVPGPVLYLDPVGADALPPTVISQTSAENV